MIKRHVGERLFLSALASSVLIATPVTAEATEKKTNQEKPLIHKNQLLKYGHIGESVRYLQQTLKTHNLYNHSTDGIYGPLTEAAVRRFQRKHQLKVDGIVGPKTISSLLNVKDIPSQVPFNPNTVLRSGDTGSNVEKLQVRLKKLGYYQGETDGIYGKITYTAIIRYQQQNNLIVDGIAGSNTINHLFTHQAKAKKPFKTKIKKTDSGLSVNFGVLKHAKKYLGVPYRWGGETPKAFDCSGYIKYVFKKSGMNIPRTVRDIWNFGVKVKSPSVGDIVFFETYRSGPSHAGIYLGNGRFIHAGSSTGVTISKLETNYWKKRYYGAKRMVQFK